MVSYLTGIGYIFLYTLLVLIELKFYITFGISKMEFSKSINARILQRSREVRIFVSRKFVRIKRKK